MELKITPSGQTIVKPTALGPVANIDTKLLIYRLFQRGRVLAQDALTDAGYAPQVTGDPEDVVPSIYSSAHPELDRSPVCRDHACMISSFVRAQPLAPPQTQTLSY